jgi:predicted ATPase
VKGILRHVELLRNEVPSWSEYPFSIPAIANLGRLEFHESVTFLVGENGSGKSTLIEAIAIKSGFNAEGGTKNFRFSFRPTESNLHEHLRLARGTTREKTGLFVRAETMFNFSSKVEEYGSPAWENLHEKSHGEAFLWMTMNRFSERGLYILDEPEAALSPQRQLSFLCRLHQLVRSGSQFVISTHSPILMAYPDSTIYRLDRMGIDVVPYEDTDHYLVTRAFLQNPPGMMERLFTAMDVTENADSVSEEVPEDRIDGPSR